MASSAPSNDLTAAAMRPSASFQTLPVELQQKIYSLVVTPPVIISLQLPIKPYNVTNDTGGLATTCKEIREKVLNWWNTAKHGYNLKRIKKYGQINLKKVIFTITVDNHQVPDPDDDLGPCENLACPCRIEDHFLKNWDVMDFLPIRRFRVIFKGEDDRVDGNQFYNEEISSLILEKALYLEELSVYFQWKFSNKSRLRWRNDGSLRSKRAFVPTGDGLKQYFLADGEVALLREVPRIVLWYAGTGEQGSKYSLVNPVKLRDW